jgi:hypothetical protein
MYQVLRLRKVHNTSPQKFEIRLIDKENTKSGYLLTTAYGTESELRTKLEQDGMNGPDIERLFKLAS